ncbi:hypothetical protein C475_19723 [Halosimplex carlsbadense 2-9-1]|uniref:Uncharacterized protein n=1 Tax=Halosimplex carlsbadense 2-9-1 TaxID=797114 RepID=M0CES2_9EURY|nr:hypothetical protein [Halosimplex carlsbadense]ELZ20862.1 hypothetical protein C475_19723 [Halosimplex carlsbadense 2-9-1]
MQDRNPAKRIPKSLGTGTKLLGSYTLTDLAVALFPGVVVVLLVQTLVPSDLAIQGYRIDTFTLPVAGAMIAVGAVFVYLTPAYTTSADWVTSMLGFHAQSSEIDHEAAKEYTQIERVYPDRGAIERTDGAVFGLVQVVPPTMALATEEEWAQKAESFQDFLNTTVEFPIQIYSTTQPFPVAEHLAEYESRLGDPDVEANPQLESLIEQYVEWYEQELAERQMTIRDHYVVVPVTPAEVRFEQASLAEQLADLPVLGLFVRELFAPRAAVEREALIDELDDRLDRVRTGLRGIDGCTAHRIDATEATSIVGEYWSDESQEYGNLDQVLRTRGMVGGPDR